jgi:GNAT superfamily N-acetyltransferase
VSRADDVLRVAGPDDVPALEALIQASVRGLSDGFYATDEIEAGLRDVFGVDTQLIDDRTYFVIEHRGQAVACGGWSGRRTLFGGDQYKSGIDARLDPRTEPARIRAFFVHPSQVRRGLGRRLYEACALAARAEGFTAFELMATLPGVPLYTSLGFEALERVAVETTGVPLPCVRMRRSI